VKVPSVGESITEGTVARWFKPSGSVVKANEPLFELETDKATTEVAAPAAGVLTIDVPEGKQVAVGSVIGHIEVGAASPTPSAAAEAPPPGTRETRQRMSVIRQRIAERLVAAQQTAAILTTFNEADLSAVMALRGKYKEAFQKKHGVALGFMSFFVKACVEA